MKIHDMEDEWDGAHEKIQKAVMKKAAEGGLTRHHYYEFQEFDIKDMYQGDDGKIKFKNSLKRENAIRGDIPMGDGEEPGKVNFKKIE